MSKGSDSYINWIIAVSVLVVIIIGATLGLQLATTIWNPTPFQSGESFNLAKPTDVAVQACGEVTFQQLGGPKYTIYETKTCPWQSRISLLYGSYTVNATSVVTLTATNANNPVIKLVPPSPK